MLLAGDGAIWIINNCRQIKDPQAVIKAVFTIVRMLIDGFTLKFILGCFDKVNKYTSNWSTLCPKCTGIITDLTPVDISILVVSSRSDHGR